MAAGRAADRASVAGYSGDSRQGGGSNSRSSGGSFGEGSMAAGRAADRASVAGYSGDSRVSRDRASFDATVNSMAAARAADRRSVPGYSADSRPSVPSTQAARVTDAYAEYARSMLQAGVTLSGRPIGATNEGLLDAVTNSVSDFINEAVEPVTKALGPISYAVSGLSMVPDITKLSGLAYASSVLNRAKPLHSATIRSIWNASTVQQAQGFLKTGQAKTAMQAASEFAERVGKISTGLSLSLVGLAAALEYRATGSTVKATGTLAAETADAGIGALVTAGTAWGAAVGAPAAGVGALPGGVIGGLIGAGTYLAASQSDWYQDAKKSIKTETESLLNGFSWTAAEEAFAPYAQMQASPSFSYGLGYRFGEWLAGKDAEPTTGMSGFDDRDGHNRR